MRVRTVYYRNRANWKCPRSWVGWRHRRWHNFYGLAHRRAFEAGWHLYRWRSSPASRHWGFWSCKDKGLTIPFYLHKVLTCDFNHVNSLTVSYWDSTQTFTASVTVIQAGTATQQSNFLFKALEVLETLKVNMTPEEERNILVQVAKTSLNTKVHHKVTSLTSVVAFSIKPRRKEA